MKPPSARTKNETLNQQAEVAEVKRRADNARKAKQAADELYPGEKWEKAGDGIFVSPGKKRGTNFDDEIRDARILQSYGSTVYLVPDNSRQPGKKYDAIVNDLKMEFKNMHGSGLSTLQEHFFTSRSQAPNVFINLEKSSITKSQAISALYGARNNIERYARKNTFSGGRIILKIKGHKNLIYFDVDSLKVKKQ